jgi:hypothetical protein
MSEPGHKSEFEASKNAGRGHRGQMQNMWDQAGINAAFESVRHAHLARKKRLKAKSFSGSKH